MNYDGDESKRARVSDLEDTRPLGAVRADLHAIEQHARDIDHITARLHASLSPEHFRLVWALRDTVEALALAEGILREQHLASRLARHLSPTSPVMEEIRRYAARDCYGSDDPDGGGSA